MNKVFAIVLIIFLSACNISIASVSEVLRKSNELARARNFEQAKQLLKDSLEDNPENYKLWLALGLIHEAALEAYQALAAYQKADKLSSNQKRIKKRIRRIEDEFSSTLIHLKDNINYLQVAKEKLEQDNIKTALVYYAHAILEDRQLLATEGDIINRGLTYFSEKNARLMYEFERYFYAGLFNFFAANYDKAQEYFEKYISLFPDKENIKIAQQIYDEIVQINYYFSQAFLEKEHDEDNAYDEITSDEEQITKQERIAVSADIPAGYFAQPNDDYNHMTSAQLYNEALKHVRTRPQQAIDLINRALLAGEIKPEYYMTLGDLYSVREGYTPSAIKNYQRLIDQFPESIFANQAERKLSNLK